MGKDWLVSRLLDGSVAGRMSWWPRHATDVAWYLTVVGFPQGRKLAYDTLIRGCAEWEDFLPEKARQGLMGEHVRLEMELIEAAVKPDIQAIDRLGRDLFNNAARQANLFGEFFALFPKERYRVLVAEHILHVTQAVKMGIEGKFDYNTAGQLRRNTMPLAAFTAEWF